VLYQEDQQVKRSRGEGHGSAVAQQEVLRWVKAKAAELEQVLYLQEITAKQRRSEFFCNSFGNLLVALKDSGRSFGPLCIRHAMFLPELGEF
jgi:hypothetical protein